MKYEVLSLETAKQLASKTKILNETTKFCNECPSKDCCPEEECVLFRIEQILLGKEDVKLEKQTTIDEYL